MRDVVIALNKAMDRLLRFLGFVVAIFVLAYVIYITMIWLNDNSNTDIMIDEVIEDTIVSEVSEENNDNIENINPVSDYQDDYWDYINTPLINVDFTELKNKNSDTVAWLQVPGTNINYPVVKTTDNSYYLTHSFDKSYNEAGWVFLDYRNNNDLTSKNNIIYAHSRLNKTMFGSLSNILKSNWYTNKDNHVIKVSTPESNSLWQVFSVYKIKTETYYLKTIFTNNNDYQNFLDTLKQRSIYDFNTTIDSNDIILTLSTCYNDDYKTVLHAKLIKKETK